MADRCFCRCLQRSDGHSARAKGEESMRVRFSPEVMADAGSWRALDRMVMHFEDGHHDWLADNPMEIEASPWLQDAGRSGGANRKALQEHIRMAAYPKNR